jgi:uncharacterized protein YdcH (DUF465 family)
MSSDSKSFQSNILKWLEYDNKIQELNEQLKEMKVKKIGVEDGITEFIVNKKITDKSIQVPSYNSNIRYSETHAYENISLRYVKDCLDECIKEPEAVNELMEYIKNKRLRKKKVSIKRDVLE